MLLSTRKEAAPRRSRVKDMHESATICEALDEFLADSAITRSASTVRTYRVLLKLPGGPLRALDSAACRQLVADRVRRQSLATAATFHGALASFMRFCWEQGWIAANPMKGVRCPKVRARPGRTLTRAELAQVYAACRTDEERLIVRLLLTGLRARELLTARELDGDCLRVLGKGGRYRLVPLDAETLRLFRPVPRSYDSLRKLLERLGRRCGVPLHAHDFRRTWATEFLLAAPGEWGTLRELGGWSGDEMVRRYAATAVQRAAVKRAREINLRLVE